MRRDRKERGEKEECEESVKNVRGRQTDRRIEKLVKKFEMRSRMER